MNTRTQADLLRATGFSSPACARAYFDVVTGSAGRPRRRKRHSPVVTAALVLAPALVAVLIFIL